MNKLFGRMLLCWVALAALYAQTGTDGSILGVVRDNSGAVVPGARIQVTDVERGLETAATSDSSGNFEVLALPRGFYRVSVSFQGFRAWTTENFELTVGQMRRLSPVLQPGDITEKIVVEAGADLVQTEKASVEVAIGLKQIRELPMLSRDPIELVNLVPGMRYLGRSGLANESTVQGMGQRDDQTSFQVDGLDSNDTSTEKGTALPSIETVEQFNVQTNNYTAESGRMPLQVQMVTKGGTNEFHGTLWEYHRNFAVDARNAFATSNAKLIRNQAGYSLGGPIIKNKTFFFSSYERATSRRERIYNADTVAPEMLKGDFRSVPRAITDPATSAPFPGNQIPEARITSASKFFYPYILLPNVPGANQFRAVAPASDDDGNLTLRVDHEFSPRQRTYVRWIRVTQNSDDPLYRPEYRRTQDLLQHNVALNHNWTITPSLLINIAAGLLWSDTHSNSDGVGKENLTEKAGLQGFPTAGREDAIGLPNVSFTGYTAFNLPAQVPGRFRRQDQHAKTSASWIRGKHTLGFGYEFNDRRTLAAHTSSSPRGTFAFNGQYTTNGFADYLLGLPASNERNFPLKSFGMGHSPYSALYAQDSWKAARNLTVTLGLRWDYWHEKTLVRNNGATFDPKTRKVVAATDQQGRVDLTAQPVAPFLAAATKDLWVPASQVGLPPGLFFPGGIFSPRLGAAWRPFGRPDWVLRAGFGLFTSSYNGNITGSQVIGPPYWAVERQTFTRTSFQRWETSWPQDPRAFVTPSVAGANADVDPMRNYQFNVAIQKTLPFDSAFTITYIGNRGRDLITRLDYNEVPPGRYTNLQAARPFPTLGTVRLYENQGRSWYNAMQLQYERRFKKGLAYSVNYVFARQTDESGDSITDWPMPFSPAGYNRGRSSLERRHMATTNAIYELPIGRGRKFASGWNRPLDAILGGWQLSGIYLFTSGEPLTFTVPGATLGNGFNTRPNLVGRVRVDNPGPEGWFDPNGFGIPALYQFGNSGMGLMDGPGNHNLNAALMKYFALSERMKFQFRWELFNAVNHVNYSTPNTTLGQANTGKIRGAGEPRRQQFALKFIF